MPSPGRLFLSVLFFGCLVSILADAADSPLRSKESENRVRSFATRGVIKELGTNSKTVLVQHEEVVGYMPAMTMPFKVQDANELAGLRAGDRISFQLRVTDTESRIDNITKIGAVAVHEDALLAEPLRTMPEPSRPEHPLLSFKFTNELGKAVALRDFRGQALAITFFFTRCPIPDYCPRLSKNFEEASRKLDSMAGCPTNWHFLSVSFDTEIDKPRVLKAYGEAHNYDPVHWSFLTGPADKIGELARLSDVMFERDGGSFNHNFRTLIIDPTGHLQTVFPTGGNLSDAIVHEIVKAAAVTNRVASQNPTRNEIGKAR